MKGMKIKCSMPKIARFTEFTRGSLQDPYEWIDVGFVEQIQLQMIRLLIPIVLK